MVCGSQTQQFTRKIRTHGDEAKKASKSAKKRELGENGENSGENKTPFLT